MREVSGNDAVWAKERSIAVQNYAKDVFSIERYRDTLKKHIEKIIENKKGQPR